MRQLKTIGAISLILCSIAACSAAVDTIPATTSGTEATDKVTIKLKAAVINDDGTITPVARSIFSFMPAKSMGVIDSEAMPVSVTTNLSGEADVTLPRGVWYVTGSYTPKHGINVSWQNVGYQVSGNAVMELSNDNGLVSHVPIVQSDSSLEPVVLPSVAATPTPTPLPTPQPTLTPVPILTPEPTVIPTIEPTPIPTEEPEPEPTSETLSSTTPVPNTYLMPTGRNKCRTNFARKISSSNSTIYSDWETPLSFDISDSQYVTLFYDYRNDRFPQLALFIPSLEVGVYTGNKSSIISDRNNASSIGIKWSETFTEWSFRDSISKSEIEVIGNESGFLWGKFNGIVGDNDSYTVVAGNFACVP